ncbi:MAG: 23S rRNA (pseudouridine(1915)-N(3))-methyltransferase RlmH [Lachnospiraceae bacterium]|nr:23S rRNA (pseudouridine(1915)-N(3))-methyltransferase RlmH [Lachnospiraceae bacterium]
MNYTIYICEKKIEPFIMDNIKEFTKRLGRYCKIRIIHLKKEQEAVKMKQTNGEHYLVTNQEESVSSEVFANCIQSMEVHGIASCSFYINCNPQFDRMKQCSISKLTMAPGLTAAILCEQIYRGYRIIYGQPYHK